MVNGWPEMTVSGQVNYRQLYGVWTEHLLAEKIITPGNGDETREPARSIPVFSSRSPSVERIVVDFPNKLPRKLSSSHP